MKRWGKHTQISHFVHWEQIGLAIIECQRSNLFDENAGRIQG